MKPPSPDDAARIARTVLGEPVERVRRFETGQANWVYDVITKSGRNVVVRISRDPNECAAGVHWSRTLRPLGVPLPEMLAHHLPSNDDERSWTVLARLSGTDLEHAYPTLTPAQKLDILDQALRAQAIVHRLPQGDRFGFTDGLAPPRHAAWRDVLVEHLDISRERIERAGAVDVRHVERVRTVLESVDFSAVGATPFLDDTTTRNVIVDRGIFQGIVDVDGVAYGDPLFVPALTRMSLLSRGFDTSYTDAWADRLELCDARRRHLDLYTAMFAVNFLAEQGQQFNLDAPPRIDPATFERLLAILDELLTELG
jgi:aminoglycoside phosphotransferase